MYVDTFVHTDWYGVLLMCKSRRRKRRRNEAQRGLQRVPSLFRIKAYRTLPYCNSAMPPDRDFAETSAQSRHNAASNDKSSSNNTNNNSKINQASTFEKGQHCDDSRSIHRRNTKEERLESSRGSRRSWFAFLVIKSKNAKHKPQTNAENQKQKSKQLKAKLNFISTHSNNGRRRKHHKRKLGTFKRRRKKLEMVKLPFLCPFFLILILLFHVLFRLCFLSGFQGGRFLPCPAHSSQHVRIGQDNDGRR